MRCKFVNIKTLNPISLFRVSKYFKFTRNLIWWTYANFISDLTTIGNDKVLNKFKGVQMLLSISKGSRTKGGHAILPLCVSLCQKLLLDCLLSQKRGFVDFCCRSEFSNSEGLAVISWRDGPRFCGRIFTSNYDQTSTTTISQGLTYPVDIFPIKSYSRPCRVLLGGKESLRIFPPCPNFVLWKH